MAVSRHAAIKALKTPYRRLPPGLRQRFAKARSRARSEIARRRQEIGQRRAFLSVIMPVYNVEGYLDEAVKSVLSQDHRNLELILVDDGSTDTSGAMCDEYAKLDRRVRVIHKKNAGLGAARNTGIAAARGRYIVFIDSDDYVLPGAYSAMIKSLVQTGSDLVTANVQRKQGMRVYQAWNQSRSHRVDKYRTTLEETPELLFDTVAWNKVYRRDFWDAHVRSFPEGKLYEDMLPVFTALAAAKTLDVLSRVVYTWRLRDEGNSITQRLLEVENIDDRFEMVDAIDSMISERGMPEALRDLLRDKVLEGDVWVYVREMRGAQPQVIARIEQAVRRYWGTASEARKAQLDAERRIIYSLIERGRAADVEAFREWYAQIRQAPPITEVGGRPFLDPAQCPVSLDDIPHAYLDLDKAATLVANVMGLEWTEPNVLTARGYAYIRFISHGAQEVALIAENTATGDSVTFAVERTESPEARRWAWDLADEHEHDGYVCHIDVDRLRDAAPLQHGRGEWTFHIHVKDGAIERFASLSRIWRSGSASVIRSTVLSDGTVAMVRAADSRPLRILFDRNGVFAASAAIIDSHARVRLAAPHESSAVWATESGTRREVRGVLEAEGTLVFTLPPPLDDALTSWWTFNADVGGRRRSVLAPAGTVMDPDASNAGMRVTADRSGRLVVRCDLAAIFIEEVAVADNGDLMLAGSASGLDVLEVSLGAVPEIWHPAQISGHRFTARLPVTRTVNGVELAFPEGNYAIHARRPASPEPKEVTAHAADRLVAEYPTSHLRDLAKIRLGRTDRGGVAVGISAPVPDSDLGRLAQRRLINRYVAGEPRDVEAAVFFCTDLGSTVTDSGLAIAQELRRRAVPLTMYWGVIDRSIAVPDGVVPIVKHSREWYEKINTCRYLVNNYGGLWGLRKGPGQKYLQTWHGTPFKYIGVSEARHQNAPHSRMQVIAAEAKEWDAVVSPSPYMSKVIAADLLFDGPVLETGYPRNDVLATATEADVHAMRDLLGIPRHAKVVLYAPTFRENQRHGTTAELYDALDLDRLAELLGREWYILLRGHGFNARNDQLDRSHGRLIDVTHHTNINDLYISADVMITDYSSVMFDFSVTGRPMAFFTPDLKQYIASRGVYFDLAATVPGPLYSDVKHLADGLRDLDALAARYAEKYAAFRKQFAPWDDGKASARVVEAFFE